MENIKYNNRDESNVLESIKNNEALIIKLVKYLEENNLLDEVYNNLFYLKFKDEPVYKIKYYKNKINDQLLNLNDVRHSYELLKDNLEDYIVYVYDELTILYFNEYEVDIKKTRLQENSKSYDGLSTTVININNNINLIEFIKKYPLLFVYILGHFNIDIDKLENIDIKNYVYKKEIKNN